MFNGKRISKLEMQVEKLIHENEVLKARVSYLLETVEAQKLLVKDFSLTLPEMTDTLKNIQARLFAPVKEFDLAQSQPAPVSVDNESAPDRRLGKRKDRGANVPR